jgi:elongation factor Ts
MAAITAQMVKDLREKTGAGMMDCKAALSETNGDMDAAVDWLRAKGLAKAAKKAGRVAADGLIGAATKGTKGALVELNSETDFVARNEKFQSMVATIAKLALKSGNDLEKLSAEIYPGVKVPVGEHLTNMIATIGENMELRRAIMLKVSKGVVVSYTHNAVAPDLGKIGVLVALESSGDKEKLAELGKQIAMHVAATSPLAVRPEEMDKTVVDRERAVLSEQARESGKPENIIAKMVEGRINKFYQDVVLLKQAFVMDPDRTVEAVVEDLAKQIGVPIKVKAFVRYALGEGVEKKEEDFAAEVAAVASGR